MSGDREVQPHIEVANFQRFNKRRSGLGLEFIEPSCYELVHHSLIAELFTINVCMKYSVTTQDAFFGSDLVQLENWRFEQITMSLLNMATSVHNIQQYESLDQGPII